MVQVQRNSRPGSRAGRRERQPRSQSRRRSFAATPSECANRRKRPQKKTAHGGRRGSRSSSTRQRVVPRHRSTNLCSAKLSRNRPATQRSTTAPSRDIRRHRARPLPSCCVWCLCGMSDCAVARRCGNDGDCHFAIFEKNLRNKRKKSSFGATEVIRRRMHTASYRDFDRG